ncbi:MAG: PASTA domain-containing protein [candidate division Zixibacteria bacterium]|nr:PASTA domain-containing protein [candidate division Zixibacteria bacterium]NIR64228.1 PASTA domain-containing protein [candidate division Zixibacteria bacterium]NIS15794.1 PASTA domain-containing protein [candidate division Zixibacteria bacterium]NIS46128.1 PASTA domain-containing protein [candidate division Zixibacteria bacterium]NIT52275.1 PASTA domain-containing protein [candidate division Zixibacteria bacterium]
MPTDKIHIPDFKKLIKPSLKALKYIGIVLAVGIVIFLLFDNIIMPAYTRHGTEYPLPDIVNMSFEDAEKIAKRYDFQIAIQGRQASPSIPEGTVLSQVPSPGTQIKENRVVKVIISAGEQMVEVPELARYSVRQAELELPEFGLKVGNYYWAETDTLANDVIAYTVPPSGSLVPRGSGIDLYINRGLESDEGYMPKVLGKPLDEALALLDSLGFPEPRVEYVTNPLLLPQIITYQHPAAGTKSIIDSTDIFLVVPVGE